MLRPDNSLESIFIYRPPVDFRKAANGLAAIVEQELGHNPFSLKSSVERHPPRYFPHGFGR